MTDINRENQIEKVVSSTLFSVWDSVNGIGGNASANQLATYILSVIGGANGISQQYASPNATGFTVNAENQINLWLILTPLSGYASGTIVLPANPVNLQQVTVNTTQDVNALTVNGNGKSVVGAPSALTAGQTFTLRYDSVNSTWYGV